MLANKTFWNKPNSTLVVTDICTIHIIVETCDRTKILAHTIHNTKIKGLEIHQYLQTWPIFKRDFLSSVWSAWLSLTSKNMVLSFIPESLDSRILPVLEQEHFENGHFWGVRGLTA